MLLSEMSSQSIGWGSVPVSMFSMLEVIWADSKSQLSFGNLLCGLTCWPHGGAYSPAIRELDSFCRTTLSFSHPWSSVRNFYIGPIPLHSQPLLMTCLWFGKRLLSVNLPSKFAFAQVMGLRLQRVRLGWCPFACPVFGLAGLILANSQGSTVWLRNRVVAKSRGVILNLGLKSSSPIIDHAS